MARERWAEVHCAQACLIASRVHFAGDVGLNLDRVNMGEENVLEELLSAVSVPIYICMYIYICICIYI